jgi:hypothetical protein
MKLKDALDKIAALEKRIEELEKRPQTVINNYPQTLDQQPLPWFTQPQPYTLGTPWCGSIGDSTCVGPQYGVLSAPSPSVFVPHRS